MMGFLGYGWTQPTIGALILALGILYLFEVIGLWFVFKKTDISPWKALIPFYNTFCVFVLAWKGRILVSFLLGYLLLLLLDQGLGLLLSVIRLFSPYFLIFIGAYWALIFQGAFILLTVGLLWSTLIGRYKLGQAFGQETLFNLGLALLPFIYMPWLGLSSKKYQENKSVHFIKMEDTASKSLLSRFIGVITTFFQGTVFEEDVQEIPCEYEICLSRDDCFLYVLQPRPCLSEEVLIVPEPEEKEEKPLEIKPDSQEKSAPSEISPVPQEFIPNLEYKDATLVPGLPADEELQTATSTEVESGLEVLDSKEEYKDEDLVPPPIPKTKEKSKEHISCEEDEQLVPPPVPKKKSNQETDNETKLPPFPLLQTE